jgi:hypothetical protein
MIYTRVLFATFSVFEVVSRHNLKVELEEVDNVCVGISVLFLSLFGFKLLGQSYALIMEEDTHISSGSGPSVGRRGVWLELILSRVLGFESLVDLCDLWVSEANYG